MSIQSPSVGVLDIKNATLRVGKLEVASVQGIDASLNTFKANSILLFDDQRPDTTKAFTTTGSAAYNTSNISLASGAIYAGLGLPNAWAAEFEMATPATGQGSSSVSFEFYSTDTIGGGGYKLNFNTDSDPQKIELSYNGTAISSADVTIEQVGYRKYTVIYERGAISASIDGTRYFYHNDIEREGPYTIGTGGFVRFACAGTSLTRDLRKIKISNDGPWNFAASSSDIAYLNGNVGIGTNSPSTTLDVAGTATAMTFSGSGSGLTNIPITGVTNLSSNVTRIENLESNLSSNSTRITAIESGTKTFMGQKTFQDDVVVSGNLTVSGTTTVVDTTNIQIKDPIIELGKDNAGSPLVDLGLIMTRPSGEANVAMIYDESEDSLEIGYTLNSASDSIITMDSANLFHMNVHGNVTASNLTVGQFAVVASYGLDHVTNENNSTGDTIISTNGTTGLQTTANVSVGRDALVSGNVEVSKELTVSGNVEVGTANLFVDTLTGNVGVGTTTPGASLEVSGNVAVSSNLEVGTANLFVDTLTGNVGIGITEPTESLDIVGNLNLQKVSNAASIKLNSNVVTEYVRSKKLIKYPRVALPHGQSATGASGYTYDGYTIKASSEYPGGGSVNYHASNAFTNTNTSDHDTWITGASDYSGGLPVSITANTNKFGESGSWLEIKLPVRVKLQYHQIFSRRTHVTERIKKYNLWASNTGNDLDWVKLESNTTASTTYTDVVPHVSYINTENLYQYYAIQLTKIWTGGYGNIGEWELYGIPEYDPEAHGTDVIMRSVPNVPNTDWLEVYYDGQDYTSMPSTITDKSGNSVTGTPTNVTFDSTWKAFVFDEADDYITFSPGKSGNYVFSASIWFKSTGSSIETLFTLNGDNTTNQGAWLYGSGNDLIFDFSNNSYNCDIGRFIGDGQWHHVCCTYNGDGSISGRDIYLDGMRLYGVLTGTSAGGTLNLTSSTSAQIGAYNHPSLGYIHEFKGSIANFRLFNRALTKDEIWQLYAYQKEYFDVSPDVVTFKGGRLGIGTSDPRAVLDVQGDIRANGRPVWPVLSAQFFKKSPGTSNQTFTENISRTGRVDFDSTHREAPGVIERYIWTDSSNKTTGDSTSGGIIKFCLPGTYLVHSSLCLSKQSTHSVGVGTRFYQVTELGGQLDVGSGDGRGSYGTLPVPGSTNNPWFFDRTYTVVVGSAPAYGYVWVQPSANNGSRYRFETYGSVPMGHVDIFYLG